MQAQAILDEYDIDGGGTIDFVEFMILIYRIQRGTVEMENNDLAQALMEAKSQLPIFEVHMFKSHKVELLLIMPSLGNIGSQKRPTRVL